MKISFPLSAQAMHVLCIAALWTAMFTLACRLPDFAEQPGQTSGNAWLGSAVASSRSALGCAWVAQADCFLHQGVREYKPCSMDDPLSRLADALSPRVHVHLRGEAAAEIMPWLWLAVRADPHNMDAYVSASFWMARELGRPDLALELTAEAIKNNPRDYRARLEQGRVLLRIGDTERARRAFVAARALLSFMPVDGDEAKGRIDAAEILTYHGLLKEERGDASGALADYNQVLQWFPGRAGLRTRVERIAAGAKVDLPPAVFLKENLDARQHVCEFERAGAGEPEHEHGAECGADCPHHHERQPGHDPVPSKNDP